MKCKAPLALTVDGCLTPVSCGQCVPCRINRARVWQHRLMLESFTHEKNCFVTLTYDNENLIDKPEIEVGKKFLKRIRRRIDGKIKFFGVGEFGFRRLRPHYHYIIFGYDVDCIEKGKCVDKRTGENCKKVQEKCVFKKSWKFGNVDVGEVNAYSCRYITGYLFKDELEEFHHMSKRGGALGGEEVERIGKKLRENKFFKKRIISTLRHGGKEFPLGRTLKSRLNNEIGINDFDVRKELEDYRKISVESWTVDDENYKSPYWESVQGKAKRAERLKKIFKRRREYEKVKI